MKAERKLSKEFYDWIIDNMVDPDVIGMPDSREEKAAYAVYTSFQGKNKELIDKNKELINVFRNITACSSTHLILKMVDEVLKKMK